MINDEIVLIACFIVTFGFIGYKISGLVKKTLDKYREDICEKINKAEKLKLDAIEMFEEIKKKSLNLDKEIKKIEENGEKSIKEINEKMNKSFLEKIEKMNKESQQKIDFEINEYLVDIRKQFNDAIKSSIKNCLNILSEEQKNKIKSQMVLKIDFKKLINNH